MHSHALKTFMSRLFFALVLFVSLAPFGWCLLLSVQGSQEVNSAYALLLPTRLHLENYRIILANSHWITGFGNSLLIALGSTALNLVLAAPAGFALARLRFPLKNLFRQMVLMLIFLPTLLLVVPLRRMFESVGLENTLWAVILPCSTTLFSMLTLCRFYMQYPSEIDDCAALMGMGPALCFWKVYLPVSGRALMYTGILQFITTWNCALLPMAMYREPGSIVTVQEALLQFAMNPSRIYLAMAAVVLTCLPCWILFIGQFRLRQELQVSIIDPFRTPTK